MRINNNVMAMNAHRQLGVNSTAQGKAIEKLSSGFRINRAGDDAAGLAISEKMRGQIRGLSQASRNAQDDISLIQTTEGALNETHDIIQRMREMAVQASNDSNTDEDRSALQAEMDQLAKEVTRIANSTEFNTRKLINGNLDKSVQNSAGDLTFHIGANTNQNMQFGVRAMDAKSLGLTEDIKDAKATGSGQIDGKALTISNNAPGEKANGIKIVLKQGADAAAYDANSKTITVTRDFAGGAVANADALKTAINGATNKPADFTAEVTGAGVDFSKVTDGFTIELGGGSTAKASTAAKFDANGGITDAEVAKGIDISSQKAANNAIQRIDSALKYVSDERAKLGAVQNRLEHTIKNVDTSAENLQASESRIRDVDMAKEMMTYTKNNILNQAAQAMLAQANQLPQGVLQLLR